MSRAQKQIVLLDHHDNPPDDRVTAHLTQRNFNLLRKLPVNGDALDSPDDIANLVGCVIYGGTHNVDEMDAYPFLRDEVDFIRACHARAIPMLGICLGAQLIAHAFGGAVTVMDAGQCEFGYYPIAPTEHGRGWMPPALHVAQAHFYQFELPADAVLLARGEACPNQAFRYGETTFGVQFHPEVTAQIFQRWQDADWSAAFDNCGAQDRETQTALAEKHDAAQGKWFVGFLDELFCGDAKT